MSDIILGVIAVGSLAFVVLIALGVAWIYRTGYTNGYTNGHIDGERRGWFRAKGVWPLSPERRPGVMER